MTSSDRAAFETIGRSVDEYCERVLSRPRTRRHIVAGSHVMLAAENHVTLRDSPGCRYEWRPEIAGHAIAWMSQNLRLIVGAQQGEPLDLRPWQRFVVGSLFGWVERNNPSSRRFTSAYIEAGKGSGKSPLTAGMMLYLAEHVWPRDALARVMARTADQAASIGFGYVKKILAASPHLDARWKLYKTPESGRHVGAALHLTRGTDMAVAASLPSGKGRSGGFLHFVWCDEYHEVDDPRLFGNLTLGIKAKENGLLLVTTNAGLVGTPCWELRERFRKALGKQQTAAPGNPGLRQFAFIAGVDQDDEPRKIANKRCWHKALPNLRYGEPGEQYIRFQLANAPNAPDMDRKVFGIWHSSESEWLTWSEWEDLLTLEPLPPEEELAEANTLIAVDMSQHDNFTSFAVLHDFGDHGWLRTIEVLPDASVDPQSRRDGVPYRDWREAGHLEIADGKLVSSAWVAARLEDLLDRFRVTGIAYDRYRMGEVIGILTKKGRVFSGDLAEHGGVTLLLPHAQRKLKGRWIKDSTVTDDVDRQFLNMDLSMNEAESIARGAASGCYRLRIADKPTFRLCISNSLLRTEPGEGFRWLTKRNDIDKNDSVIAFVMVIGLRALLLGPAAAQGGDGEHRSVYDLL